jgi:tripartite-type tricarboxylate transporter receptor subunit TctC
MKAVSVVTAACLLLAGMSASRAETAAEFYRNRQVSMLIGTTAGGGYDIFGRMFARHMGKYLPGGTARFIVKNMPGAGGLAATNYTYNVGERDGTLITTVGRDALFEPLLAGDGQARFDPRHFLWLGTPNVEVGMIYVSSGSGVRSIEEALRREVTLATAGSPRSPAVILPRILNELIGTKFKVIPGYPGSMEAIVAMERGEVDGRYSPGWAGPEANKINDLVAAGKARLLAYLAHEKDPSLGDLPNVMDLTRNPDDRQVLGVLIAAQALGRPYFAPPGIPEDRAKALQDAFAVTMKDQGFLADAAIQKFDIIPKLGPDMTAFINQVYATPAPLMKRAIDMLNGAQK